MEDQKTADERIPWLLKTPAAVRGVSVEPMLGPISLAGFDGKIYRPWLDTQAWKCGIHWVICGGESGPNARPMQQEWARSLRDQCTSASVPFFFKQWGEFLPCAVIDGKITSRRVGKKAAGRMLDGQVWDQYPGGE